MPPAAVFVAAEAASVSGAAAGAVSVEPQEEVSVAPQEAVHHVRVHMHTQLAVITPAHVPAGVAVGMAAAVGDAGAAADGGEGEKKHSLLSLLTKQTHQMDFSEITPADEPGGKLGGGGWVASNARLLMSRAPAADGENANGNVPEVEGGASAGVVEEVLVGLGLTFNKAGNSTAKGLVIKRMKPG